MVSTQRILTLVLWCRLLFCLYLPYVTVFYTVVLYCIVLYCVILYCIVLYCIVLYCIALCYIALCCVVLCCVVLCCVVLCYTALHALQLRQSILHVAAFISIEVSEAIIKTSFRVWLSLRSLLPLSYILRIISHARKSLSIWHVAFIFIFFHINYCSIRKSSSGD